MCKVGTMLLWMFVHANFKHKQGGLVLGIDCWECGLLPTRQFPFIKHLTRWPNLRRKLQTANFMRVETKTDITWLVLGWKREARIKWNLIKYIVRAVSSKLILIFKAKRSGILKKQTSSPYESYFTYAREVVVLRWVGKEIRVYDHVDSST